MPMKLPCGNIARFDTQSGCSYRCETCFATVGSVGMPRECRKEMDKWKLLESLGGKGWDYSSKMEL